jgi:hypothetical protein
MTNLSTIISHLRQFGWVRCISDEDIHIVPPHDLRDHFDEDCWCIPEVEDEHNCKRIIIHNSMDRREEFEEGRPLS